MNVWIKKCMNEGTMDQQQPKLHLKRIRDVKAGVPSVSFM